MAKQQGEHTKGEWKASQILDNGKAVIHTGDLSLPFVEVFPNRYRQPPITSEICEANANLIAAAPDLYEALRAAQAYMARKEMYSGVQDRTGLEVKIIKALSKAERWQAEGKNV